MKMRFWMDGNELAMEVDGERYHACFDVCSILCENKVEIEIPGRKYKIGDEVFNGYVGLVAEVGIIPTTELYDAGKPGYGIKFYEIDPDTNLRTDELCNVCWFPVEKVDSWDPLPPAMHVNNFVHVTCPDGDKWFICLNQDGSPHDYSGWSRLAAFRDAWGREPRTKHEFMTQTFFVEPGGEAREFKRIVVTEDNWPFPKGSE